MIRFENVTKRYRGTAKPALNEVSFNVERGDFVFLVGASGSGKSSCLRLIMREDVASNGQIHVLGHDLKRMSSRKVPYFRRQIGSVFQDFRLLSSKNVFQNVAFALQVTGASRALTHTNVERVLELVGLTGKEKRMPSELSGGEQQRVAIARAIVGDPKLLLADEPTGNLDPATSTEIMRLLARINATGTTVVMATHEAGFVDQMKRRVIELKFGELMRDEEHGGYGDTSAIPRLAPVKARGEASAEALSAMRKVQREVATGSGAGVAVGAAAAASAAAETSAAPAAVVPTSEEAVEPTDNVIEAAKLDETPALTTPADTDTADEAEDDANDAGSEPSAEDEATKDDEPAKDDAPSATSPRPLTRPIVLPEINVAELGVADRLGLSDFDDDDEVGPTS
ncbi:cell division ATP-binding protein FtsE [Microbacterium sp. YY-03]|uniref:cell division ATP-binding protein FtsE n=1 Tax=Microbacterium sp. YY-03 TaxID=3421636 RepID=UPI003D171F59